MDDLQPVYAELAGRFEASFPAQAASPRTVGRELEFPVVTRRGTAADVRQLWEALATPGDLKTKRDTGNPGLTVEAAGNEFSYTIEVGVGTMELNTRPCTHLFEVKAAAEQGVARLVRAAAARDWLVLGYGIQPVTPPTLALMTPKQRYQSLYRAMGEPWLWYTVTAADQVHVAIGRDEAILMLNFGNLIAPVLIALCANSPVWGGTASPYCSAREAQHVLIHASEHRHGMPARPFRDAEDFVARLAQATYLIRRSDNLVIPSARPFAEYLREHGADYAAFLFHEHYVWNSARVRAAYGTVELRPACQQPWREHMAASALGVGLVCARAAVEEHVADRLGTEAWEVMRRYHRQTIRAGLGAPQPAPGFLRDLVGLAQAALEERGFGEEALLEPLYERLYRRENPAQRARRVFLTDGPAGLLAHAAIRPTG
jgi:gamma-glutamylcysteine synthetase